MKLDGREAWIAEHSLRIFVVVAALMAIAAGFAVWQIQRQNRFEGEIQVLRPQVTRVSKAICDQESLHHLNRARSCAERIRVGLVNCRHSAPCRAAFLAIATYPPPARSTAPSSTTAITTAPDQKGGATQQPSNHGHQQPGPSGGQEGSQEASPAPSGPPAAEHGPPAETPGNGPPGAPGGSSSSGAGVEVCAVKTCVGAEVGLGGLTGGDPE
jgi:hypothetical protein